ncbi:hypothetical protein IQ16_03601 [Bradyrhizobium huanghuaihaiense]|uniref:Uncharacterized protein n=1 Tax=Bradyrhizobium huanghuaihaiense TaxID=990078 RepID=A0A562RMY1_9BRAD|nr:hypothetical protein [Bradyrhizobium huanghuaihaiense]TWI70428.1 hypothetical protein IQ16_03601 [Bradyrhizobium huanghuaihaiense]
MDSVPTISESLTPAHVRADGDFTRRITGFVLVDRPDRPDAGPTPAEVIAGIVDAAAPAKTEPARHKAPRPGLRGKGSKPARQTNDSFEPDYDAVAEDRRCARIKRAKKKDAKDKADSEIAAEEGLSLREWRDRQLEGAMKRVGAYVEWMEKARAKVWVAVYSENLESAGCTDEHARKMADAAVAAFNKEPPADPDMPHVSDEDRRLINDVEKAQAFCAKLYDEATRDANGVFHHPGGLVAGKYLRAPFSKAGKKSDEHVHYKAFAASVGKAARGNLFAGDTKDSCHKHVSKLYALDKPQIFFSAVCKDFFRIELDIDFPSEAHMRAHIANKVDEHDLPSGPQIGAWFPDDRRPGEANHPHLYFRLPEGSGVWPWSPERQHRMLKAVIAKLTEIFGGDKGGTAHPYSGKNPLSWLTKSCIMSERMPTLIEWFEALGCEWEPDGMPDDVTIANLHDAAQSVDKESAAWWRVVQGVAFSTAKAFYRSGKVDLGDRGAFAKKIRRAISGPLTKELRPSSGKQSEDLSEMIEKVCDYAAESFDPAKCDRKRRNHGAAAHLIEPDMTMKQRYVVGGEFSGPVRIGKTVEMLAEIIRLDLLCGRTPTIASVAGRGRCYNTVARHFDEAYAVAKSRIPAPKEARLPSLSLRGLFRGIPALPAFHPLPGQAAGPDSAPFIVPEADPPEASAPASPDKTIDPDPADLLGTTGADEFDPDDFIVDALRRIEHAKRRRLRPSEVRAVQQVRQPGSLFVDFRASGIKTLHRSIKNPVLRSAVA